MVKHSSKSFFLYPIIGSVKKANPKSEYNFIARKLDVSSHVVYSMSLLNTIKLYNDENISKEDLEKIHLIIKNANNKNAVVRKEHTNRINESKYKIEAGTCPRCGGRLVEKSGKYGAFIGCSNYPKCKYVLKKGI
jgi:hypothetical protein